MSINLKEKLLELHWNYYLSWQQWLSIKELKPSTAKEKLTKRSGYQHKQTSNSNLQSLKKIITIYDKDYPEALLSLANPPLVLYCLGASIPQQKSLIAIVGTRKPTVFGSQTTEWLAAALAQRGYGIVSGLANGIDTIAHETTLNKNQYTLAIVGSGLNKIYPKQNLYLVEKIIKNGGTVISEQPDYMSARREFFPQRNRLIAAISAGCCVTEGGPKSGAAITGKFALNNSQTTVVFTQSFSSQYGIGAIRLIEAGATPVTNVNEAIAAISLPYGGRLAPNINLNTKKNFFSFADFCKQYNYDYSQAIKELETLLDSGKIIALDYQSFRWQEN